jgi:hypothetical protein
MAKKPSRRKGAPSAKKAKTILHDGTVHGRPLTERQRRFFGAVSHKGKKR